MLDLLGQTALHLILKLTKKRAIKQKAASSTDNHLIAFPDKDLGLVKPRSAYYNAIGLQKSKFKGLLVDS